MKNIFLSIEQVDRFMIIQAKAYAKINLCLKILDRLPNGYHNIFTVMQKISLHDDIKIDIQNKNQNQNQNNRNIKITCSDESIGGEKNIAYKAADLFLTRSGLICGISIEIKKNIPSRAGLGGGSSDAAAVLLTLNKYFNYAFSENELIQTAMEIGADVPFFVKNKSRAVCTGIGEIITPVRSKRKGVKVLIAKPFYNISTKQAFEDFDEFKKSNDLCEPGKFKNDFTALAFSQNENLKIMRDIILGSGASESELSGSGSALFGIFYDVNAAQKCRNTLTLRNDVGFCDIFDFI